MVRKQHGEDPGEGDLEGDQAELGKKNGGEQERRGFPVDGSINFHRGFIQEGNPLKKLLGRYPNPTPQRLSISPIFSQEGRHQSI